MSVDKPNLRETLDRLKHDTCRYSKVPSGIWKQAIRNLYSHPAYASIVYYRLGRWAYLNCEKIIPKLLYLIYRFFYPIVRWFSGVELQARTQIGPGLVILHFGPVVIHPAVIAGENLTILPGVTIGRTRDGTPSLGNNVSIGSGVVVIGPINIGDEVNIGAGAVVIKDLPSHCTAVGIPARIIT